MSLSVLPRADCSLHKQHIFAILVALATDFDFNENVRIFFCFLLIACEFN
jgi:hypothetical protein